MKPPCDGMIDVLLVSSQQKAIQNLRSRHEACALHNSVLRGIQLFINTPEVSGDSEDFHNSVLACLRTVQQLQT